MSDAYEFEAKATIIPEADIALFEETIDLGSETYKMIISISMSDIQESVKEHIDKIIDDSPELIAIEFNPTMSLTFKKES